MDNTLRQYLLMLERLHSALTAQLLGAKPKDQKRIEANIQAVEIAARHFQSALDLVTYLEKSIAAKS